MITPEQTAGKPLRVLFVEDSQVDADYLAFLLKNEGFTLTRERVDTAEALEQALKDATWDVIISDYKMPHLGCAKALDLVRKTDPDIPFVVVSGAVGEDVAVELMNAGANDFISKTNLHRLVPAIKREMRETQERQEHMRAEERIQLFSRELMSVREEEKKRVSSALHHDVGSLAVGLAAYLDAIEKDVRSGRPREALKWIKRARKLFDQSVVRLKKVAIALRPPELDVLGLCVALRHHFSQVTSRGNVRIHFTQTLGRRRLPDDIATIVFRIVQEALTNAIKHGHAKKVDVSLSASEKELSLTVCNNGRGFRPTGKGGKRSSHLGLHMMEEMATSVGGVFKIESVRGKETTVSVSMPIRKTEDRRQKTEDRRQKTEDRRQKTTRREKVGTWKSRMKTVGRL